MVKKKKKNESDQQRYTISEESDQQSKKKKKDTRILEAIQVLQQEVCSVKKLAGKKKKRDAKILEAIHVLQQQSCSMQERIKELEGNKQQEAQESPSALPPPSSQTDESSTAKYKLVIKSEVSEIVHIGRPIVTTDGNGITVAMEDLRGNQVAAGHRLASAKVELVVLDESFDNVRVRDWTKAIFEESIITPLNEEKYIKNAISQLTDGKCTVHESTTFNKSSKKHPVKLGVRVIEHSGERVLEGVSNSFFVRHRPRGKKSEEESSPRPRIPNSRKKNGREKRRATKDAQLPMANASLGPDFAGSDTAPATQLAISPEPTQYAVTSNGGTDTDTSRRPLDPTGGYSSDCFGGDDLIANNPHFLAGKIIGQIRSVEGFVLSVLPGNQALLGKIYQLETSLRRIYVQLQPQVHERNTFELRDCLQVVGETMLQLTMDATVSLHHEGPTKNLFNDLQRLQRDLVEILWQEAHRTLELLDQYRGNGTCDQNLHGNSHGTAYREYTNSQHDPPIMQDSSAEAHHHPSAQGEMTGGTVENTSATSLRLGGQVLIPSTSNYTRESANGLFSNLATPTK